MLARVGQCKFRRYISIKERESAFIAAYTQRETQRRYAREEYTHVVTRLRPGRRMGRTRWRRSSRMVGCRYSLYTLPGQRIPGGLWRMYTRARAYTTDRAKPINFPFNSPGPSSAPSRLPTYSSCSSHTARLAWDRFRIGRYSVSAILRLTMLRILAFSARRAPVGFPSRVTPPSLARARASYSADTTLQRTTVFGIK